MQRINPSFRRLVVAFGAVSLILPLVFVGLFLMLSQFEEANAEIGVIRVAQFTVPKILQDQLDEQASVRAYVIAHGSDRKLLRPYVDALVDFQESADKLAHFFTKPERGAGTPLAQMRRLNATWRAEIAQPLRRGIPDDAARERRSEALVSAFRHANMLAGVALASDYQALRERRATSIHLASYIAGTASAIVLFEMLILGYLLLRMRSNLDRDRVVMHTLQSAYAGATMSQNLLDVATTYLSATSGTNIGGDIYDVFLIDEHRVLITIADVSGKGVGAAVDSLAVRHTLRAFASEYDDIAVIVTHFNTFFTTLGRPPESFVVLFTGIYDQRSQTLTYVNAGNEPAYVITAGGLEQLAPTGIIIGVDADATYIAEHRTLAREDIVVIATDGLTEARSPSDVILGNDMVLAWLRDCRPVSPEVVVEELRLRLRAFTSNRSRDDLAILALRPSPVSVPYGSDAAVCPSKSAAADTRSA
jgi:serine phosphatase RsbU (regulator of sigma subunit)